MMFIAFGVRNKTNYTRGPLRGKEAEALMHLNEKTSCSSSLSAYSNVKKSSKGAKGKGKPKFFFPFSNTQGRTLLPFHI
ncbi:hypothetical protein M0R45_011128 [Rubus argutus]|uniref:Uncharacterized protein n=1 Tax=Rubus argutus TaxID=59490 RepID=A0AAW1YAB2_RUBAR